MKLETYQEEARKTQPSLDLDDMLKNAALGLSGEAGEVTDLIKKVTYHGHDLDSVEVAKELGDVLWYVAMLSDAIGISMNEIMQMNIDKLRDRYKTGKFTPEESKNRKEYKQKLKLISISRNDINGDYSARYEENGETKETTLYWKEIFEVSSVGKLLTDNEIFYKIMENRK